MFKTLGKEPVKFMFNVGLNSLEDLLLVAPTDSSSSSISVKKKGGGLFKKKSKDTKGSDVVVDGSGHNDNDKQYASEAELGISEKTQFVVHWSRGRKHSGKTEPKSLHSVSHKVVWMDDISIKGTLFRDTKKGAYSKKLLSLQIEEIHPGTKKGKIVGKADVDLGKIAPTNTEDQPELTETIFVNIPCTLHSGHVASQAKLKISLNMVARSSNPGDADFTLASTFTGIDTERSVDDMDDDRSEEDSELDDTRISDSSSLTSTPLSTIVSSNRFSVSSPTRTNDANSTSSITRENSMLREHIADLQKQMKALKSSTESKKSRKDIVLKLQKERDESEMHVRQLERDLQNVKIELEHLQASHSEKEKRLFEQQLLSQSDKTALNQLEQQLKDSQSAYDELKRGLDESHESATDQVSKLEAQNASLEEQIRSANVPALQTEIERLKNTLSELQAAKAESDREREEMGQTIRKLQMTAIDEKNTVAELDDNLLRTELSLLQEQYERAQQQHSDEIMQLKQQNDKFEHLKDGLEDNIEALKSEYKNQINELEVAKIDAEREIEELKDKVDVLQNQIEQLHSIQEEDEAKSSHFKLQISDLESEKQQLQDLMTERESQLASRDEKIQLLEERIEQLEDENDSLNTELRNTGDRIDSIQKGTEERVAQFDELRIQLEKSALEKDRKYTSNTKMYERKLHNMQRQEIEKFVLDNVVLHLLVPEYVQHIPITLKPLFLCVLHWRAFDTKRNTTFATNTLLALDYVVDKHVLNIGLEAYWLNFLYRMLNLLQSDFKEQVEKNLQQLTEEAPEVETFTTGDDAIAKQSDLKLKKKLKRTLPEFVRSVARTQTQSDEEEMLEEEEQQQELKSEYEAADDFIRGLCDLLLKTYMNLLTGVFRKLEKRIDNAVFDPYDDNANASITSPDGGPEMQRILSLLERYYHILNDEAKLEKRVIVHFFEHIALFIDAYIFNSLMKSPKVNAGRALQIKMSVSFLVNWFEDNGVKAIQDEENVNANHIQSLLFPLSRQAADVCVIAQKTLLTDEEMREIVCPSLTVTQIAHLLSHYAPDEFDSSAVSPQVLATLRQIDSGNKDLQALYIKPRIKLHKFRDPSNFKLHKRPLFDFSEGMQHNNALINTIAPPSMLLESKFAEQLSFLNQ